MRKKNFRGGGGYAWHNPTCTYGYHLYTGALINGFITACLTFGFLQKKLADEKQVVLSNVSILATEGNYKCQVSGEGPLFATAAQTKRLRVASM